MALRLYVWEGNGISSAYHDDGTLVVLAESPEQAREVIAESRARYHAEMVATEAVRVAHYQHEREVAAAHGGFRAEFWKTEVGKQLLREREAVTVPEPILPDGSDEALAREPDRVVELDAPTVVAFNGGGYD